MERTGNSAAIPRRDAILRWSVGALAAVVAAFHAELLLGRIRDASIAEPLVALRWLVALAVVATAGALRRRGLGLLGSRAGAVLAVAVLVLHGGVVPPAALVDGAEELLVALPVGLAALAFAALAAPARERGGLLASTARRLRRPPDPPRRRRVGALPSRFASRPPPAR